MKLNYLLTAIAALGLVASFTPSANAQFRNYNRYSNYNNSGDRIGTPGFSQPIFMPNRGNTYNTYPNGYYRGYNYNRNYRGKDELTIINGGNNCVNCGVNGWERRDNDNWHHRRHRKEYFYY
ncbi:hypothetical protein IQ218_02925 [Synechocystis salina LEGE 06099]|uniref:hypothetical protein n=1 Tax=Synechocystis salina TaxID=945780 RepID=UPI00187FCF62|nr:hypothetical protein [Synechocystis salina]MBE9202612.1 hypothetical protein [Synechocystis salina LEGE 06099]